MWKMRSRTQSPNWKTIEIIHPLYEISCCELSLCFLSKGTALERQVESMESKFSFPAKFIPFLSDTENSVISPYGILAVLTMVAEGAKKESLDEILAAVDVRCLEALRDSICSSDRKSDKAFRSENSIVLQKGEERAELLDQFKQIVSERYCATIQEQEMIGMPTVQLQNIASFQAQWLQKMERDASYERKFHHVDGSNSCPAFLNCTGSLRYFQANKAGGNMVQAVALPYKVGEESVPFELILLRCESTLTESGLSDIISSMRSGKCKVEIPEFSVESEFDLRPMLEEFGLRIIFDPESKALDCMATVPMYADSFTQKAEIWVDREGTIAKATTRIITSKCILSESRYAQLIFNRPFHYFLRNTDTGEILFLGRVNRLTDCERESGRNDLADFFDALKKNKTI